MKIRLIKEIDLNDKTTFWRVEYKPTFGFWGRVHSVDAVTCDQRRAEALYDRILNKGMKQLKTQVISEAKLRNTNLGR